MSIKQAEIELEKRKLATRIKDLELLKEDAEETFIKLALELHRSRQRLKDLL